MLPVHFSVLRAIKRMNIIASFRQDSFVNGNWNEYLLQIINHQDYKQEDKMFVILSINEWTFCVGLTTLLPHLKVHFKKLI